jgi:putative ABC transport system substrate-binding protein
LARIRSAEIRPDAVSPASSRRIRGRPECARCRFRAQIVELASARRVPVVSGWADFADAGALFSYGPKLTESYRRLAYYVDRVLKGEKLAELPIERPTVFEFVVNSKTAKALGIELQPALIARADRVIE